MRAQHIRAWAWLGWLAVVAVASVLPVEWLLGPAPQSSWSALGAAAHFLEYFILAALVLWSGRRAVFAIAFAVAAGVALEAAQWPLPYRSADVFDLAADLFGAVAAAAALSATSLGRRG